MPTTTAALLWPGQEDDRLGAGHCFLDLVFHAALMLLSPIIQSSGYAAKWDIGQHKLGRLPTYEVGPSSFETFGSSKQH
jgi:hypothetical protein